MSLDLQKQNRASAERVLAALDLPVANENYIVNSKDFIKIQIFLRYFTAMKKQYIDFWIKVGLSLNIIFFLIVYEPERLAVCQCFRYLQLCGDVGPWNIHNGADTHLPKVCKKFLSYDVQTGLFRAIEVCS